MQILAMPVGIARIADKAKVEIIPKKSYCQGDVAQLAAERARLLARVAEIDAVLDAGFTASQP